MKQLGIVLLFSLVGCGRESSPEGRSQIRDEHIQREIDSLKNQNNALLDSVRIINKEINRLKHQ